MKISFFDMIEFFNKARIYKKMLKKKVEKDGFLE